MHVLVTGGLGFIGSALVRRLVADGDSVLNVDAETYAADHRRVAGLGPGYRFAPLDVTHPRFAESTASEKPDALVHLAAHTHVTRSETDPDTFFRANVEGTRRVLQAAEQAVVARVVHVSTDEVYGPCDGPPFKESDKEPGEGLATSAYARSKALADDLATGGSLPVTTLRLTNCYGAFQHPEKALPRWITRAIRKEPLPVWGGGGQQRMWLSVDDAVDAMLLVLRSEENHAGTVLNVAPPHEGSTNLEVARRIAQIAGADAGDVYLTEYDRPDHDRRYAIDSSRMQALGWAPEVDLGEGLQRAVKWYQDHVDWWTPLVADAENIYSDSAPRPS